MSEILSMAGSLVLIVVILVLTYYGTRWYARRAGQQQGHSGKYIKVLDRSGLGAGASVTIVQVGERYYMLGVGDKNVNLISELTDFEATPDNTVDTATPFTQTFRQMLDKAKGVSGKDGDSRP